MVRLSDLQDKAVINLTDGKNIGNIIDLSINESGKAIGIIVEKKRFIISSFSSKKETEIRWEQIDKIGKDVIFVNIV